MGDVSIIARRLKNGTVQYGWSGNWGAPRSVGYWLLYFYPYPEAVDYLFSLGQLSRVGLPREPADDGHGPVRNCPTGKKHWRARSEQSIFSKIAFVDHAYFYDLDGRWYYIMPGRLCIKIPLWAAAAGSGNGYGEDCMKQAVRQLIRCLFLDWPEKDPEYAMLLDGEDREAICHELEEDDYALNILYRSYDDLLDYFDQWAVAETEGNTVTGLVLRKKGGKHVETIYWTDAACSNAEPGRYRSPAVRDCAVGLFLGYLGGIIKAAEEVCPGPDMTREVMTAMVPEELAGRMEKVLKAGDSRAAEDLYNEYEDTLWESEVYSVTMGRFRDMADRKLQDMMDADRKQSALNL